MHAYSSETRRKTLQQLQCSTQTTALRSCRPLTDYSAEFIGFRHQIAQIHTTVSISILETINHLCIVFSNTTYSDACPKFSWNSL